ncbi:restriction endonuclease subunit S [Galactobacter valiniphilus]|nr:restriction endonuclease subunit S [Galactobacter valiniphilus]
MMPAADLIAKTQSLHPSKHPFEQFSYFSIPAYDAGQATTTPGGDIGSAKQLVLPGDVLISKIVPHIRRVWVVPPASEYRQVASQEWIVFRSAAHHAPWLRHFLLSEGFHRQFMTTVAGVGGSLLRARPVDVGRIPIPVPPLNEQRRIADILDRSHAMFASVTHRSELLAELHESLFIARFGTTQPSGQTVANVAMVGPNRIRTGPFGSQLLKSELTDSGPAVLGIDSTTDHQFNSNFTRHISQSKFETLRRFQVHPGDVLITIMGTLGRTAIVPDDIPDAINTKHMVAITPDRNKILPEFLQDWLRFHPASSDHLGRSKRGAIMGGLNMGLIKSTPLAVPPLARQQEYASQLSQLKQERMLAATTRAKLEAAVASLSHRAFRGAL